MDLDLAIKRKAAEAVARLAARTAARGYLNETTVHDDCEMSKDMLPMPINRDILIEAEALYNQAILINPLGKYYFERANLLSKLGDFEQAIYSYKMSTSDNYMNIKAIDKYIEDCHKLKSYYLNPESEIHPHDQLLNQLMADIDIEKLKENANDEENIILDLIQKMTVKHDDPLINSEEMPSNQNSEAKELTEFESNLLCELSEDFVWSLVDSNWDAAYSLLDENLKNEYTISNLKNDFINITNYTENPVTEVEAFPPETDMPDITKDHNVAWMYVSICGDDFNEAVSFIVCRYNDEFRIKEIEWGRP